MKVIMNGKTEDMRCLWYDKDENQVCYIDQRLLPSKINILKASTLEENAFAIKNMVVRGAPAIGIAGAWALYQALQNGEDLDESLKVLRGTRPTARDLFHYLKKVAEAVHSQKDLYRFCMSLEDDLMERCRKIGENGESLITEASNILTHCNAGVLATLDWGTALAPMRMAKRNGKNFHVYVDETRPLLQGSRLTAWELGMEDIPHTIIADSAAGYFMAEGLIDLVITGADRITAKGYAANKIGTYSKAVVAKENEIPFYIAAPKSTFDLSINDGSEIPIEMRDGIEITHLEGRRIAARGSNIANPAFDVTPPKYITGFITEVGVLKTDEIEKKIVDYN